MYTERPVQYGALHLMYGTVQGVTALLMLLEDV